MEFLSIYEQSHDSSDDYKFPLTTNETLKKKTAVFMLLMPVIGSKSLWTQTKQFFKIMIIF